MTILSARGLAKAYGPQTLFADLSLNVSDGERVGLLGVNGTGKSTLLRIVAGLEPTDAGVIDRRRNARVLYLPQEPELRAEATARQSVAEGLADWHAATARHAEVSRAIDEDARNSLHSRNPLHAESAPSEEHDRLLEEQARLAESVERLGGWQRDHTVEEMLAKLGVTDLDRPVGTMSGGERRRVALARLLVAAPELAILDEPTNHLDAETIEWLEGYLLDEFQGAVLLVTHDRYVLDAICGRILELEGGKLREFQGNYADYVDQKATLLEHEARVEGNRLNLLRRERAWLSRGARARTTKQKARIQRAEAIIAVKAPKEAERVKLEASASRTGKTILELHDLGLDLGGRTLIDALTLHMVSGDRVGIVGPNGAGKTSLLKLVTGELTATRGKVVLGKQTKVAYFDQARAQLEDGWSIYDNVAEREGSERTGGGMVKLGDREIDLRTYLEQFLFEPSKQRQKVSSLSGGERARVALAKMLRSGANLLLLDEPTNDLDIATLGALEEMLESWAGCALVVTHDRYFLNRVVTSILAFDPAKNGKVVRYPGNYDTYRSLREDEAREAKDEAREARDEAKRETKRSTAPPPPPLPAFSVSEANPRTAKGPTPKALTYAERMELDQILERIELAEREAKSLEAELASPELYNTARGGDVKTIQQKLASAQGNVAALSARWEALEARKNVKR